MPGERSEREEGTDRRSQAVDAAFVTKVSPWSMADTVTRLFAVVAARGMEVFAVIDHGGNARHLGLDLRSTKLVIFGSPSAATPVIEAVPLAALDLPLRIVVWEDSHRTLLSYASPAAVARSYRLDRELADTFSSTEAIANAVINR